MKVSLIVPTYNWPRALEVVLKSALNQTRVPDEIIVADDGSREETVHLVASFASKDSRVIHSWQEDDGFRLALSRNLAMKKATGDYIIHIDGDMYLEKHFIEDHLSLAKKGQYLQGGRVLLSEKQTEHVFRGAIPDFFMPGIRNRKNAIRSHFLAKYTKQRTSVLDGIRTANISFFKEDAEKVNGFDNRFIGWGREDSEFVARLEHSGTKRRDIRHLCLAYHLFHNEASRDSLPANHERLEKTLREKISWTDFGMSAL